MAYDKHTWTCDEPITVERLNHIEDGIANAGGDCDCGYECEETRTLLTEETVTTVPDGDAAYGSLSYSQFINQDTITVTFNGTEYECEVKESHGDYIYGALYDGDLDAWDWSEYPFQIYSFKGPNGFENTLATEIEGMLEKVTTTPCFKKAVKSVSGEVVYAKMEREVDEDGCYIYTLDITDADLAQIIRNGQQLVILEPMSKGGSTNYAMHYPTLVWADGVSPALPIFQVSPVELAIL